MSAHLTILVFVSFETGRGGGHLIRGSTLVRNLRKAGHDAFLALAGDRPLNDARTFVYNFDELLATGDIFLPKRWTFIVTDRFITNKIEFEQLRACAPLVGIDEGGDYRAHFDVLVDLLPPLPLLCPANLTQPSLLPLPKNRKSIPFLPITQKNSTLQALVVFGLENAQQLTERVEAKIGNFTNIHLTVIKQPVPQLCEHLAEYDVIITHFGLTAFESLAAGTPVLLISPSKLHEQLARAAGLVSLGIGAHGVRQLERSFRHPAQVLSMASTASKTAARRFALDSIPEQSLAGLFATFHPQTIRTCPVCGATTLTAAARFPEKTYWNCQSCQTISMSRSTPPPIHYSDSYFFEDYKNQYGKTYLDDFQHLQKLAFLRLKHLDKTRKGFLLDVGCAYGPFLAAARETGWVPFGLDPSEGAVRFVNEKLGIYAVQGFFPDKVPKLTGAPDQFDAITLWYVIEHLTDCAAAFQKLNALLKLDGMMAFSTPSASGVSGRSSLHHFLEQSPADHWTIWHPHTVKRILAQYGFYVEKIIITGHHPERIPFIGSFLRRGTPQKIALWLSKLFGLGDTFEVYARKFKPYITN